MKQSQSDGKVFSSLSCFFLLSFICYLAAVALGVKNNVKF